MKIFLFSGSGNGSGKSSAARLLTQDVWSLANAIRSDMQKRYPGYNWFNKSSDYKNATIIPEYGNGKKTMRQVMVEVGQQPCLTNPTYWVDKLIDQLRGLNNIAGNGTVGIDDIRKVCELKAIRSAFPGAVTHFHVDNLTGTATIEPEFENEQLALLADYRLTWGK